MKSKINLFKVHKPPHNRYLNQTLNSAFYAEGPRVAEFEEKISDFVSNDLNVALNSCTSALYLAFYLSGLKDGKAVISTPMTSPAGNVCIPRLGGKILWADIDPTSGNICPKSVRRLINKYRENVVAVMAMDWGGIPCDFDELNKVVGNNAMIIDDAAHSIGALYKNRLTGSLADFTCFSFQAIKHITTGDGGLLTCKEKKYCERARRLRWFGIERSKPGRSYDDDIIEAGFKFHMNDIAASMGLAQLEDLESILTRRREIAKYYTEELKDFKLQKANYDYLSSYWLFTIQVSKREKYMHELEKVGIETSPVFKRNDTYKALMDCTLGKDNLKNTDLFDKQALCIPVGEWLTDQEVEHIVSTFKNV